MTNLLSDIKQWIMPTPQWILTPKAETKLDAIGALTPIKDVFNQAVANTNRAYSSILPDTITPLMIGIIAVGIVAVLLLLRK